MPASLNPMDGLSLKYENIDTIHLALYGFIKLIIISIGITSVDWSFNCLCNSLAYQSWNCEHKKSLADLFTDKSSGCSLSVQLAGYKMISKLWLSKNLRIEEVVWALKLLKINNAGWSLDSFSSFLFSFTYGKIIFSKYCFIVNSFDQWLSEHVTCHADGKSNWGKHRFVFPSEINCRGKSSPVIDPQNTAVICLLSWSKVSPEHNSKQSGQSLK